MHASLGRFYWRGAPSAAQESATTHRAARARALFFLVTAHSRMFLISLQVQQVRAIRAAGKDYYKILGVPKGCDSGQLKKAYRKVSLSPCSFPRLYRPGASAADSRRVVPTCLVFTALPMVAQLAVKLHPDKWYGV